MDEVTLATELATLLGIAIGLGALAYAVRQFRLSQMQFRADIAARSAERFLQLRERLKGDPMLREICTRLDAEAASHSTVEKALTTSSVSSIPFENKRTFIGLFEEVALLVNSGFIPEEVAHYMFGYYALMCDASAGFWTGESSPDRDNPYWIVFFDFIERMRPLQGEFLAVAHSDDEELIRDYVRKHLAFR